MRKQLKKVEENLEESRAAREKLEEELERKIKVLQEHHAEEVRDNAMVCIG